MGSGAVCAFFIRSDCRDQSFLLDRAYFNRSSHHFGALGGTRSLLFDELG